MYLLVWEYQVLLEYLKTMVECITEYLWSSGHPALTEYLVLVTN